MAQFGMAGLAVMGSNLARNIEDKGYSVAVYDIDRKTEQRFMDEYGAAHFEAAWSAEEFVRRVERPRRIMMMIRAGEPVDSLIGTLLPYLEAGDTLIDGGNSDFHDTRRRCAMLAEHGVGFLGTGVSGGEQGALHGPSLMPGGSAEAWENSKDVLLAIAAKAPDGTPCCAYLGPDGAGHFTKTVHNGIEYGDMQLICEAYQFMREGMELPYPQMSGAFRAWNEGMLEGYLMSVTADILEYKENGEELVPHILDVAGQKGTGKWTLLEAVRSGVPATVTGEALFARFLTAKKEERIRANALFDAPQAEKAGKEFLGDLGQALLAAKIVLYAQGCSLLEECSGEYGWGLDIPTVAGLWRGGCIIRSNMLEDIMEAFGEDVPNLLIAPKFVHTLNETVPGLRRVVAAGAARGTAMPAMTSTLAFFDGYRTKKLPANLLQAQRDYFGAHGYSTEEDPGAVRHTDWTGRGGKITAGTYRA